MSESCPVSLQIRDSAREPTPASLEIESLPFSNRLGRAAVRLLLAWGLALPCVLVPLLHFVLVPGLLLLGPVLAWLTFRQTVRVKSERINCPKCGVETDIEPGTTGWPVSLRCGPCGTTFSARREVQHEEEARR